jgi:hypothetical protein
VEEEEDEERPAAGEEDGRSGLDRLNDVRVV